METPHLTESLAGGSTCHGRGSSFDLAVTRFERRRTCAVGGLSRGEVKEHMSRARLSFRVNKTSNNGHYTIPRALLVMHQPSILESTNKHCTTSIEGQEEH
jgi:hypothetical protein